MSLNETINTITQYITGNVDTQFGKLCTGIWNIFSHVNGNPEIDNYGIRFTIMLFFSLFLILVIQIRTKLIFDRKHMIAFIGALFLVFRIVTMLGFEWGWQIKLYDDYMIHLLFPPLEHFWNMLFFGCIAYYTLNVYEYYPGLLKKILWLVPVSMLSFFIYTTIQWKIFFLKSLPEIPIYNESIASWQNHLIISIIAFYVFIVAIVKYKKYHCFISAFWTLTFIEHFLSFICEYNMYSNPIVTTLFHSISTWSLPLIILHFISAYIPRVEVPRERRMNVIKNGKELFIRCDDCLNPATNMEKI